MRFFIYYFAIFFAFSIFLKVILPYQQIPVQRDNSNRLFGIIPYRELFSIPLISFAVLYTIKKYHNEQINLNTLSQSILYMFITGIVIHGIFGVKSMLSYKLKLSTRPDGTGLAPYTNY